MKFGSLFAGIGGFDLGFERAGMTCAWQVEKEPTCHAVLRAHFPGAKLFDDVSDCHSAEYLASHVRTIYCDPSTEEEVKMAGQLKKLTVAQVDECVKMYERGLALGPIAAYFNVTRQAMWDLLRRRIQLRPQLRRGADNHFYRGGACADGRANDLLEHAIRTGIVKRKSRCDECGSCGVFKDGRSAIQAHHDDYNKPLDVRWLCQECHHEWHKTNTPKRKEAHKELARVDVVCGGFP